MVDPLNGEDGNKADQNDWDGYVGKRHDRHVCACECERAPGLRVENVVAERHQEIFCLDTQDTESGLVEQVSK